MIPVGIQVVIPECAPSSAVRDHTAPVDELLRLDLRQHGACAPEMPVLVEDAGNEATASSRPPALALAVKLDEGLPAVELGLFLNEDLRDAVRILST